VQGAVPDVRHHMTRQPTGDGRAVTKQGAVPDVQRHMTRQPTGDGRAVTKQGKASDTVTVFLHVHKSGGSTVGFSTHNMPVLVVPRTVDAPDVLDERFTGLASACCELNAEHREWWWCSSVIWPGSSPLCT
jgi:hypothetical protein